MDVKYDVDSVWVIASSLSAFKLPSGIHHIWVSNVSNTTTANFSKKTSLEMTYQCFTFTSRCEFPVKIMLSNISGYRFLREIFIQALNQLPTTTKTSIQNGSWLWAADPVMTLDFLKVKVISVHSNDFETLDGLIRNHMHATAEQLPPHVKIQFGIYMNGLQADSSESILPSLDNFLDKCKVEMVVIHHAAVFQQPDGSVLTPGPELPVKAACQYKYMGCNFLIGFSARGRDIPEWCLASLSGKTGYVQGYFPGPAHAVSEKFANSPITLYALFGSKNQNNFLRMLKRDAMAQLSSFRAALIAYQQLHITYRIEAVMEWRNDQPLNELEQIMSMNAIHNLAHFATERFFIVSREALNNAVRPISQLLDEVTELSNRDEWLDLSDLGFLSGAESLIKCAIQGNTRYVNYHTMRALLGNHSLGECQIDGILVIPAERQTVPTDVLLREICRSERATITLPATLLIELLDAKKTNPDEQRMIKIIGKAVIKGVAKMCNVSRLKEATVRQENHRVNISGKISYPEVLEALRFYQCDNPMRVMMALLLKDGVKKMAPTIHEDIDCAIANALDQCDVFPRWRPLTSGKDYYQMFFHLYKTTPRKQILDGMLFLEDILKARTSRLAAMGADDPSLATILALATHLAEAEPCNMIKWTALLLLLLECSLARSRGLAFPAFRYAVFAEHMGPQFLETLVDAGVLIKGSGEAGETFLNSFKVIHLPRVEYDL